MISDNQTVDFLTLLYRYLQANPTCIAALGDKREESEGRSLLGYYDDVYYYIYPEMYLSVFRAFTYGKYKFDAQKILRELFAMDLIKVHWVLTGEVRYRPQKRIGKTRKRYITIYRSRFNQYIQGQLEKEKANEQG